MRTARRFDHLLEAIDSTIAFTGLGLSLFLLAFIVAAAFVSPALVGIGLLMFMLRPVFLPIVGILTRTSGNSTEKKENRHVASA